MGQCPKCQNDFTNVPGFCPYDGHPVAAKTHCGLVTAPGQRWQGYERLIGQTFDDRYTITHMIGQGGMGVVFGARHQVIERELAIKVLPSEIARQKNTVERFVREAKAASRVNHPNIVEVTDFGMTPQGLPYFVMEHVNGVTLSELNEQHGPLRLGRIRDICTQVAAALDAAHQHGVAHRDLKPDNIFVVEQSGRDFVKIVDFGIAKIVDVARSSELRKLTRAGSVFGTPEYMSPEQAAGRDDVDYRADIYSLGVVLTELVAGGVPIRGDNMQATIAMQILEPPKIPKVAASGEKVGPNLDALMRATLEKDREQRLGSMQIFVRKLEEAIPMAQYPGRRRSTQVVGNGSALWPKLLAAVIFAAAAVAVALYLTREQPAEKVVALDAPPPDASVAIRLVKNVKTRADAKLFLAGKPLGKGQAKVTFTGSPLVVTCLHPQYHLPGEVIVTEDSAATVECKPRCHKTIKDPFEDCSEVEGR